MYSVVCFSICLSNYLNRWQLNFSTDLLLLTLNSNLRADITIQIGLETQACKIWWINKSKSPSLLLVQKLIFSNDLLFVVVFSPERSICNGQRSCVHSHFFLFLFFCFLFLPPERGIWNGQCSCLHSQILMRPRNPEFARVYLCS